jgi:hypothetical protein
MPIAATSYEAQVSAAMLNMLAASATFQTLTGAASAAAARAFLIEDDGGQITQGKACDGTALNAGVTYFVVRTGPLRRVDRAFNTYGAEGEVGILGVLARIGNESDTDALRRARNAQGGIRADLEAMFGTIVNGAAALVAGRFDGPPPEITDTTGPLRGRIYLFLDLAWRDIP